MEIFTEVEFQGQELQFLDLTKRILQDEGWEMINEEEYKNPAFSPIGRHFIPIKNLSAVKCWFKRII